MKRTIFRAQLIMMVALTVFTTKSLYAYLAVLPTDDPTENACFQQDVNDALNAIKMADPVLNDIINELQDPNSKFVHTIKQTNGVTTSDGERPEGQDIFFNPGLRGRYPEGVCTNPPADLLHELIHALDHEAGDLDTLRKTKTAETNYIRASELNAVNAENLYRRKNGLCPRLTYDGVPIPVKYRYAGCEDPKSVPCPTPKSHCSRCCCDVYGLVTTPSGGALGCTKDNITPNACRAYIVPQKVNASCQSTPCNIPSDKPCP